VSLRGATNIEHRYGCGSRVSGLNGVVGSINSDEFRVLLISPLPPPAGGISTWSERFLDWAADNRIAADIVNTAVIGDRRVNVTVKRNFVDEFRRTWVILRNLRVELRTHTPNVVHLNATCGGFGIFREYLCAALVYHKRVPLVVQYRFNVSNRISSKSRLYLFKGITLMAQAVIVLNAESGRYVKRVTGRECWTAANFVDDDFVVVHPKDIAPEIHDVLFVGWVIMSKGVETIFEVARSLPAVNFDLAGPISGEALSLSKPDNVRMLGQVDHDMVRSLLDGADVFLLPSHTEGFSNALLEAMARGVPVITTPVGNNAEMIEDSGGRLVRVGSAADILAALDEMASQELRTQMSCWNVGKVRRTYTTEVQMRGILEIYHKAIAVHRLH